MATSQKQAGKDGGGSARAPPAPKITHSYCPNCFSCTCSGKVPCPLPSIQHLPLPLKIICVYDSRFKNYTTQEWELKQKVGFNSYESLVYKWSLNKLDRPIAELAEIVYKSDGNPFDDAPPHTAIEKKPEFINTQSFKDSVEKLNLLNEFSLPAQDFDDDKTSCKCDSPSLSSSSEQIDSCLIPNTNKIETKSTNITSSHPSQVPEKTEDIANSTMTPPSSSSSKAPEKGEKELHSTIVNTSSDTKFIHMYSPNGFSCVCENRIPCPLESIQDYSLPLKICAVYWSIFKTYTTREQWVQKRKESLNSYENLVCKRIKGELDRPFYELAEELYKSDGNPFSSTPPPAITDHKPEYVTTPSFQKSLENLNIMNEISLPANQNLNDQVSKETANSTMIPPSSSSASKVPEQFVPPATNQKSKTPKVDELVKNFDALFRSPSASLKNSTEMNKAAMSGAQISKDSVSDKNPSNIHQAAQFHDPRISETEIEIKHELEKITQHIIELQQQHYDLVESIDELNVKISYLLDVIFF